MSSAPLLADITVDGRPLKVVAVPSKQALALRLRSRDRRADLADRGEAGAAGRRARRVVLADAAASARQAAGVRAQHGHDARRSDRLHAGAARAGARSSSKRYKIGPASFTPPIVGNVDGLLGAITSAHGTAARTGRAAATIPRLHIVVRAGRQHASSARSLVDAAAGFSDIRYVSGVGGQPFRRVLGPGDCCAADSPRDRAARRARRSAAAGASRRRRSAGGGDGGAGPDRAGAADREAAVRRCSRRSISNAASSCGRRRTATRRTTSATIRALQGHEHSEDGQASTSGVGLLVTKTLVDHGRSAGHDDAGASARRDAARLRQADRARRSAPSACPRRRADRR